MDRELIVLGTGYALAVDCYNTCFAIRNGNEYMLVDAGGGNGIFKQCRQAGIDFENVHHIFVTHAHTDHLLGVIWVIRKVATLMVNNKYEGTFVIHCHQELKEITDKICSMILNRNHYALMGDRIVFEINEEGKSFEAAGINVTPFDIRSTKKQQFGFRAVFEDGYALVCLGDEPYNPDCAEFVRNADLMMCESFCLYSEKDIFRPYEKHHATVMDAAVTAKNTGARSLLLYHTEDSALDTRAARYSAEAAEYFSGRIFVPEDLERIELL